MRLNKLELSILLATIAAAIATCPARANIGDTYSESCAKFGKSDDGGTGWAHWMIDDNFTITEEFGGPNGTCDAIYYYRFDRCFSNDEVLTSIAYNVSEAFQEVAVPQGRFWSTQTDGTTALLCLRQNQQGRNPYELSIWTQNKHARYANWQRSQRINRPNRSARM